MAVADVAVAMGPRSTRRLTIGGIGACLAAALVVGGTLLIRSPGHSGSAAATPPAQVDPSAPSFPYGMTTEQVRQLLGAPAATHGMCWQYSVDAGTIGSVSLAGVLDAQQADGMRFCFFAGALSNQYLHLYDAKKHRWIWVTRFYLGPSS